MDKPYCHEDTLILCLEKNPSFKTIVGRFSLELDYSRQRKYNNEINNIIKTRPDFKDNRNNGRAKQD